MAIHSSFVFFIETSPRDSYRFSFLMTYERPCICRAMGAYLTYFLCSKESRQVCVANTVIAFRNLFFIVVFHAIPPIVPQTNFLTRSNLQNIAFDCCQRIVP